MRLARIAFLFGLVGLGRAVDHRTAEVRIKNNTPMKIAGVSVMHKYSDNYKNRNEWGIINPGEIGEGVLTVDYNTGPFTTGRDWWAITWFGENGDLFYSDPNNLREVVDALEGFAPDVISAVAAGIAATVTVAGSPVTQVAAGAVAAAGAKVITSQLFNSESTVGFKQHILRDEDSTGNLIIINDDWTITFESNSGISETLYDKKSH